MGATGVEPMRLEIVPIHLLRQLGYESEEETVCAALPVSATGVEPMRHGLRRWITLPCHGDALPTKTALMGSGSFTVSSALSGRANAITVSVAVSVRLQKCLPL